MAGGGVKGGQVIGETDEIGWNVVRDPIDIHDLHATMLHLFGLDHEKLTYRFQGRDFRLTTWRAVVRKSSRAGVAWLAAAAVQAVDPASSTLKSPCKSMPATRHENLHTRLVFPATRGS
jgi:hypothetical protein